MADEKRLIDANALGNGIGVYVATNAYLNDTALDALGKVTKWLDEAPTVKAVPIDEVFRVIAGHSNYHGDNILAALTCIAEGKNVNPVRPLEKVDAVEVVRCFECRKEGTEECPMVCKDSIFRILYAETRPDDFCSYGERKPKEDGDAGGG